MLILADLDALFDLAGFTSGLNDQFLVGEVGSEDFVVLFFVLFYFLIADLFVERILLF